MIGSSLLAPGFPINRGSPTAQLMSGPRLAKEEQNNTLFNPLPQTLFHIRIGSDSEEARHLAISCSSFHYSPMPISGHIGDGFLGCISLSPSEPERNAWQYEFVMDQSSSTLDHAKPNAVTNVMPAVPAKLLLALEP